MVEILIIIASILSVVLLLLSFKELSKEYMKLDEIIIPCEYKKHKMNKWKLAKKRMFYLENGYFKDKIIINEMDMLIDGYSTYLLAKEFKMSSIEVTRDKNGGIYEYKKR